MFLSSVLPGDITQKGYEKKKSRLLQPYFTKNPPSSKQMIRIIIDT